MSAAVKFRPYQTDANQAANDIWSLNPLANALLILPTGGGKTVVFAKILADNPGPCVAIAHREELVSQISIALARNGVYHRVIGPDKIITSIVTMHMEELGRSFYNPTAQCAVAGVDTLMSRNGTGEDGDYYTRKMGDGTFVQYGPRTNGQWGLGVVVDEKIDGWLEGKNPPRNVNEDLRRWAHTVTLWVQDEAHHVVKTNKWGKAAKMFPRARGLGVTATAIRADGCGLGRHHDGLFDHMYIGPSQRDLINMGYLTDYKIFIPPNNIDLDQVTISKTTGDYNMKQLSDVTESSSLVMGEDTYGVGDIVKEYLKIAPGKLGITFVPNVVIATKVAEQFNAAGVPAAVVHAKTPASERRSLLRKFKNRELLQLVNVDLFGEGFDLPAIEVVSMGRRTESTSLFVQQAGRALRLMISGDLMGRWDQFSNEQRLQFIADSVKPHAIIIDHVGNVERHAKLLRINGEYVMDLCCHQWTLDRRDKQGSSDIDQGVPTRVCLAKLCQLTYDRSLLACPHCGEPVPIPKQRDDAKFVDGDLFELDQATLATLYKERDKMHVSNGAVNEKLNELIVEYRRGLQKAHVPKMSEFKHCKKFAAKTEKQLNALETLKECMAWWAGHHRADGRGNQEIFKLFYLRFDVDWLSAQALATDDAEALAERVIFNTGVI